MSFLLLVTFLNIPWCLILKKRWLSDVNICFDLFQEMLSNIKIIQKVLFGKMKVKWPQYNTIQYNTIQYNKNNEYNTIQYNTIQYNTIQKALIAVSKRLSASYFCCVTYFLNSHMHKVCLLSANDIEWFFTNISPNLFVSVISWRLLGNPLVKCSLLWWISAQIGRLWGGRFENE